MAGENAHPLLETFAREGCSAILRTPHAGAVGPAMEAAVDGGFRIIEFTRNTPGALDHVREFSRRDDLIVGAGTILSAAEAREAVEAGARFIVSPVADEDVIRFCVDEGVLCIPGCFTPTEMLRAHRLGAHVIKLFPGPPDGPSFVRVCRGPLPFLRIFPTSGVTLDNVAAYLEAGAFGVGFVNCLFEPADLAAGRFDAIRERAAQMVTAVRAARSPR
ncbi:MAG: bifunctional 4-hydroxy-2-oxoglutarate aldolase/2-dehydro-3-deoxy-phosphogluconate aldolase [Planctomycetota bacterium]|nr:bifunctional 4-hydroxy-2-oxoglutarate aldolase/2-dehydro-3-deoxy-phosphogluconate aldolase [Planctomycetota bacterium]MDA0933603.1 bifunctional 4-hydroxy-2-oxoglutarate aldolase/2-dehydro-3-deoxy-phosphogluconate aldolase [Planctomycetota bacterium]MDA1220920.1 bifunctional 4-hydroxy-2-oxoglutarate aldolase/2-dehydro-3-deoxy-phosphogluconate aldolase [Planctomycetota bacterium]